LAAALGVEWLGSGIDRLFIACSPARPEVDPWSALTHRMDPYAVPAGEAVSLTLLRADRREVSEDAGPRQSVHR
jgi:hypothetical protein